MQEPEMNLLEQVPELKRIKNYQWYTVLQQLVSVAQHPCDLLKSQVSQIVKHILGQYTEHVVWQIIGMLNVVGSKKDFMMPVPIVERLDCRSFDQMTQESSKSDHCLKAPSRFRNS